MWNFLHTHSKRIVSVLVGFVGGAAPLLMSIASDLYYQPPNVQHKNALQMIGGLLLFAGGGAFVVFAVGETELLKAFIQGIGAPAMISAWLHQAETQASKKQDPPGGPAATIIETEPPSAPGPSVHQVRNREKAWSLIPEAYAQPPSTSSVFIPDRVLEVKPKGDLNDALVEFFDASGRSIAKTRVQAAFTRVAVPPSAAKVVFSKETSIASPSDLPDKPGGVVYYEINGTQQTRRYNFLSSVTGQDTIEYDLRVEKIPINVLKANDQGWAFVGRRAKGAWTATYLDFHENQPDYNRTYTIQYYVTVLDNPSDNAHRLGRLTRGQKVMVSEFRGYNLSESAKNKFTTDGDYYAHVTVLSD